MTYKRALIFGSFDGLHSGHREFISYARRVGEELFIALTPDELYYELHGRLPRYDFDLRKEILLSESIADQVIKGDHEQNTWHVISIYKPDVIILGVNNSEIFLALNRAKKKNDNIPKILTVMCYY